MFLLARVMSNNSFKPKLLRSGNNMAEKACHVVASTTQFGLTQALGPAERFMSPMQENPYSAAASRYSQIVLGAVGCGTSIALIIWSLSSGHVPEFTIRSIGPGYFAASHPSQFWFTIVLFGAMALGLGWVAWRAYRQ